MGPSFLRLPPRRLIETAPAITSRQRLLPLPAGAVPIKPEDLSFLIRTSSWADLGRNSLRVAAIRARALEPSSPCEGRWALG
jgi:hypothetical protein